jgi:hypothetical protein
MLYAPIENNRNKNRREDRYAFVSITPYYTFYEQHLLKEITYLNLNMDLY